MLIPLTFAPSTAPPAAEQDVVELLLECHVRIRHHAALGLRLARGEGDAEARAEAAGQLLRYFGTALLLHAQDEDESLWPLMRACGADVGVEAALEKMAAQHVEIEARLGALCACWKQLAEQGTCQAPFEQLLSDSQQLSELFCAHLELEETFIFPAVRQKMPRQVQQQLREQLRARREPPKAA
jgi:iron-sulfur cluster repair protein YtfE (RIC family)